MYTNYSHAFSTRNIFDALNTLTFLSNAYIDMMKRIHIPPYNHNYFLSLFRFKGLRFSILKYEEVSEVRSIGNVKGNLPPF